MFIIKRLVRVFRHAFHSNPFTDKKRLRARLREWLYDVERFSVCQYESRYHIFSHYCETGRHYWGGFSYSHEAEARQVARDLNEIASCGVQTVDCPDCRAQHTRGA